MIRHNCEICGYETWCDLYGENCCMDCKKPVIDKIAGLSFVAGFNEAKNPHKTCETAYLNGVAYRESCEKRDNITNRITKFANEYLATSQIPSSIHENIVKDLLQSFSYAINDLRIGDMKLKNEIFHFMFFVVEFNYSIAKYLIVEKEL